jgi:hypothetical protein
MRSLEVDLDGISFGSGHQGKDSQGKQIMRFFFETVPMNSSVAAG